MTFLKKSLRFLPDKSYIKLYYRLRVGRKLNMGNPTTLNEKLQWMKFNYRFPLQTICLGILCVWIIGITSSSFVLSVFGFCFYEVLVLSDLKQMKNLYSSSAGKRHKICSSIPGGNK